MIPVSDFEKWVIFEKANFFSPANRSELQIGAIIILEGKPDSEH